MTLLFSCWIYLKFNNIIIFFWMRTHLNYYLFIYLLSILFSSSHFCRSIFSKIITSSSLFFISIKLYFYLFFCCCLHFDRFKITNYKDTLEKKLQFINLLDHTSNKQKKTQNKIHEYYVMYKKKNSS